MPRKRASHNAAQDTTIQKEEDLSAIHSRNSTSSNSSPLLRQDSIPSEPPTSDSPELPASPVSPSARRPGQHSIHALVVHHRAAPSPLSKEAPEQSYRGLINVAALLLVVSNLRLIMENISKYGILVTLPGGAIPPSNWVIISYLIGFHWINVALAWVLEALGTYCTGPRYVRYERALRWLMTLHLLCVLMVPTLIVWHGIQHPAPGTGMLLVTVVLFLKLTSYHLVNAELRYFSYYQHAGKEFHHPKTMERVGEYPENISWWNLILYIVFPTLCYQPVYPREPSIRWTKVARHAGEFMLAVLIMYVLIWQYIEPLMRNTMRAISDPAGHIRLDIPTVLVFAERLLKLGVAVVYFWLTMFCTLSRHR
jgi:diacylglycerol O-acyltransferase-1